MTQSKPTFRPRFSLLTLALLMTIVALSVTVAMMYRELAPLRSEVARYRQELGLLTIDDAERDKIHAVAVESERENEWRYRIYLPEGKKYRLRKAVGMLPPPYKFDTRSDYLKKVAANSSGSTSSWDSGEFLISFWVHPSDKDSGGDDWTFETRRVGEGGKGSFTTTIPWMAERRLWSGSSSNVSREQRSYDPDKPLELLEVRRGVLKESDDGKSWSVTTEDGETEGFKLWIEPE